MVITAHLNSPNGKVVMVNYKTGKIREMENLDNFKLYCRSCKKEIFVFAINLTHNSNYQLFHKDRNGNRINCKSNQDYNSSS